mmetsp:Transcript_6434/g.9993  ORF Transcript_6434/g.9993 Transcript_6434/m.9993 type:complete len:252 (+) Transcript_6434:43-798(+)
MAFIFCAVFARPGLRLSPSLSYSSSPSLSQIGRGSIKRFAYTTLPRKFQYYSPQCVASVSVDDLRELLKSERQGDRLKALIDAPLLAPDLRMDILVEAAKNERSPVRTMAVGMLADYGHTDKKRAAEILFDRLRNETEVSAQSTAADTIAALRLDGAYDILVEAFTQSKDWVLRMSVVAALGELGDERAFDFLAEVLKTCEDGEQLVWIAAIGALGDLKDKRAIPLLEAYTNHEDEQVRQRVQHSIAALQQ